MEYRGGWYFEHWILKVHLKFLNITYRGCQYYSLTEPTLPRRAQQQDSSPLGLEEMRLTGEGQQQNIAFYDQCITNYYDEQRNAFNIIAVAEQTITKELNSSTLMHLEDVGKYSF